MINRLRLWKKAAIVIIGGGVLCFTYVIDVNSAQKSAADSFYFLKRGMFAYKNGQINQAISDLQRAARMGNIGASWKFGHIYADGDGVPEDDYRAYKFFAHIVKKVLTLAQRVRAMFLMHW
ncbi:TPR repeat protein [Bartonella silvatica]|uniref:TPR repeat protein n=1 Tax=Bartonella silvatica TaxID=357760 RepID=A0ABV2HII9_9HYPH